MNIKKDNMIIKNEGKEFITIESTREDALFILNSLILGIQNISVSQEDKTRFKNFINDLSSRLSQQN